MGINSFKLFLAFKRKGEMIPDNYLVRLFRRIAEVGGVALIHAENGEIIDALEQEMIAAGRDDGRAFAESRPPLAETEAIHRVLAIGALTGCPVYIVHMSVGGGLDIVRRARERGQTVYAETCPQYLTLTESLHDELGVLAKIAPPLRTQADLNAFWAGIRDGTVDVVGSDHNGSDRDYKYKPNGSIWDAGFGAPMIETMLPVMYHAGVVEGRISMPQLARVLAERPAEVFGIADRKGSIVPGLDADLIIWDPKGTQTIRADGFHSNAFYTFYEGWQVQGRLALAMQRGTVLLDEDGQCHARAGDGRFLARPSNNVPERVATPSA
jgi:dihydropyrimidinase